MEDVDEDVYTAAAAEAGTEAAAPGTVAWEQEQIMLFRPMHVHDTEAVRAIHEQVLPVRYNTVRECVCLPHEFVHAYAPLSGGFAIEISVLNTFFWDGCGNAHRLHVRFCCRAVRRCFTTT
jgi:hypothetical protein